MMGSEGFTSNQPQKKSMYRIKYSDYTFYFAWDREDPEQLHITVRHLTTPDDVLNVFFAEDDSLNAQTHWNVLRQRFETRNQTHLLYWGWIEKTSKKVLIMTCVNLTGGMYSKGGKDV